TGGPRRGGDQRRPVRGGLICRNDRSVCREQTNRRFAPIGGQAGCMTATEPLSYRDQLADRLFRQRILRLTGEVDDEMAERVCSELVLLPSADDRRDIVLHISSPGRSVFAGLAIYDTIQLVPNDIVTVAAGFAASMGQVLLAAGTKGKRASLAHSRIMMHQPSAGFSGTAVDIAIQAENLE